jgi:hypothetical protein
VLQLIDFWSSHVLVSRPGFTEHNGLILELAKYLGLITAIFTSKVLVFIAFIAAYIEFLRSSYQKRAYLALLCIGIFYLYVVLNNLYWIFH